MRYRLIVLLLLLIPALVRADAAPLAWDWPGADSTTRVYTAAGVQIAAIDENGPGGPFVYSGPPATTVTMRGRAVLGAVTIANPGACWWVAVVGDQWDAIHRWDSDPPCRFVLLPLTMR